MSLEQISKHLSTVSVERLDRLESNWLSGGYPDIASYLCQPGGASSGFLAGLVELDLEYRWKRYQPGVSMESRDQFGFPLFPQLEDYANLLSESERSQIMNPRLLAEEYRVRWFWGDQPSRRQFLDRIPHQSLEIELALAQIDTEFIVEGMTPLENESASSIDAESTLLNHLKQATSEICIPSPNIGKYQLKTLLGRGGFGEVWKAYDPNLKRNVALKFPRPDRKFSPKLMEFFRREAQKMAALEQVPGVVPVYESGEANGIPYIVSFLVEGSNLGSRQKDAPLPFEESVRIVAEVATTLHRAHLSNLFHRDVKLSNILVNREGRAYLSDFGLCVSEDEQLHESHSATGTYAYMSPEQIQGQSHRVDGRADIYSLGVVFYRLLTNRFPYVAETPAGYMDQVVHREPRPPRSIDDRIPAELERICLKCLRKSISDRYTTAGDLANDLRSWLSAAKTCDSTEPIGSAQANGLASPATSPAKRYAAVFAFFCLLSAAIALSYFRPWEDSSTRSPERENGESVVTDEPEKSGNPRVDNAEKDVLFVKDISPALSRSGVWEIREDENAVLVSSTGKSVMKSLCQLQGDEPLQFEIKLSELRPGSKLGIFFGMSDLQVNSQNARWQVLFIEHEVEGSYRVSLEARELDGVRDGYQGLGARYFSNMDRLISVRMTITAEGLESLLIQNDDHTELVSEYQNRRPLSFTGAGRIGMECNKGQGVFSDPVINGEHRNFRRIR